ncbi:MAG: tetratricopeptide repeat protein [Candidatus Sulfotelmatobacter sp.]
MTVYRRLTTACALILFALLPLCAASAAADENSQDIARATTLIQAGKLDQAEAQLWDVLKQHPDNASALNLLGTIRLQQKRYAESEALLNRTVTLAPEFLPARVNLARLFNTQGDTDKEISTLLEAARLAPTDADVDSALASAYLKQNDYRRALDALQRIPASTVQIRLSRSWPQVTWVWDQSTKLVL